MNTTTKTYLLQVLQESEAKLLSLVHQVDEASFLNKSTPSTWSIAEIVEHLIIADNSLLQGIKKKGQNILETTPETLSNEQILKLVPTRQRKVTAPSFLEPQGKFSSKAEAIQAFRQSRANIENFVATTDLPLEKIAFKHFILGLINGEGWIVFMASHCFRHIEQIEELNL